MYFKEKTNVIIAIQIIKLNEEMFIFVSSLLFYVFQGIINYNNSNTNNKIK